MADTEKKSSFKLDFGEAAHKAQRKAFDIALDAALKHAGKDRQKAMLQVVDLMEKTLGDTWRPEAYWNLRNRVFNDADSKWMKFTNAMFDDVDPKIIKLAMMNMGYEGGFRGFHLVHKNAKKYGCDIPWLVLFDPTSACNLHCTGCWAAEYGHTLNLSYEDMDSLVTQAKALGTHSFMLTGGEPLVRKADILKLAKKHQDCGFHIFTNGTLIDEQFCRDMLDVANIVPSISVEGFEKENDSRRGAGTFQRVMHAMDLMKQYKLLFGTSICYTSVNYKTVTSDEFLDMIIDKGVKYTWYFHYMPVGNDASTDLLLNPEQREYMYNRVREIRGYEGGKPIMAIDFQNDGEFVSGCVAGGKYYCHINPAGDVEPCVFIHYSSANIHDKSWIECLQQPLFKDYQANQPFNKNLLRPCPMLENPAILQRLVKESGAHSTDMTSPEPVEHLCGKCMDYAKCWQPSADRLWNQTHPEKKS
jgi:MoaA/NifB/PqqE/SkfB family radical SAM enzyme